jgi:beta-lactamase regulating signal transducer with metallopeptidase domain
MERAMLEYLANALWQLPVLAAGAWVLLWLMKPGPRTQYRVWLAVLGFAVLLPAWGIRGGEIAAVPGARFDELATARIVQRSAGVVAVDTTAPLTVDSVPHEEQSAKAIWRLPSRVQRVHLSATATHWVMGVYVGSVLLGLLRVVKAWRSARGLVEVSQKVVLCSSADAVLRDFGRSFEVSLPEVRECAAVTSPMVVGAMAPVVLLPEGFAGHAEDEVRAALLHELAHVKRRDYVMNGVCQLAGLPVNWHPVAYVVQQRIRRTREMACDEMAAREMRSELGYARCLVTMARRMLGGGLAERPEFVGLFSNNVLEERVTRLTETKTVLSARAKLVRLASGATAMAAATLMATSFHVVPTMAAESEAGWPAVQTAVLRAVVPSSADVPVVAQPACVHRLAKAAVAPDAPVSATPVTAPVAVAWSAHDAMPEAVPVALAAPQSVPAVAPPSPVAAPPAPAPPAAPAGPKAAPAAPAVVPVAPTAPAVAPAKPTAPEMAPVAPATPADEENAARHKKKNSYVYRMTDPDGEGVVIIDGNARALTPEEKRQVEKGMADSAEGMKRAMDAFKNGDLARHMADLQQEMAKLKIKDTFDSPEFRREMETARRELAQSALVNNAELQARVQSMMKNFDKQKMNMGHCKDGIVKDKEKLKKPANPENQ